jgi:hypothetical protein
MASTYVDNFHFTDTVNTQSVAATQYNSNEGAGTLNEGNYKATSSTTHTIPTALRAIATGAILDDGYSQKSLYELFLKIQTCWDTAMASLDDSGGVAATTFVSTANICAGLAEPLSGKYHSSFMATTMGKALGLEFAGYTGINPNGMSTRDIAIFCQAIVNRMAVCNAILDADATITDTNYASTLNITFSAKTGWIPPLATTTAFDITNPASKIKTTGIDQEALVDFLNTVVTNLNALWVKLDADI